MGWHVEIENMTNRWNIQTTGGNIRGDKIGHFAIFELIQHAQAHMLVHVAMQRHRLIIVLVQRLQQIANILFAIAENNPIGHVFGVK